MQEQTNFRLLVEAFGQGTGFLVGVWHLLLLQARAAGTPSPISLLQGPPCPHPPQGPRGLGSWNHPQLYLFFTILCPVASSERSLCFLWKHEWKAPAAAHCSLQKWEKFRSFPTGVNSKVFSELPQAQKCHGNVCKCRLDNSRGVSALRQI